MRNFIQGPQEQWEGNASFVKMQFLYWVVGVPVLVALVLGLGEFFQGIGSDRYLTWFMYGASCYQLFQDPRPRIRQQPIWGVAAVWLAAAMPSVVGGIAIGTALNALIFAPLIGALIHAGLGTALFTYAPRKRKMRQNEEISGSLGGGAVGPGRGAQTANYEDVFSSTLGNDDEQAAGRPARAVSTGAAGSRRFTSSRRFKGPVAALVLLGIAYGAWDAGRARRGSEEGTTPQAISGGGQDVGVNAGSPTPNGPVYVREQGNQVDRRDAYSRVDLTLSAPPKNGKGTFRMNLVLKNGYKNWIKGSYSYRFTTGELTTEGVVGGEETGDNKNFSDDERSTLGGNCFFTFSNPVTFRVSSEELVPTDKKIFRGPLKWNRGNRFFIQ